MSVRFAYKVKSKRRMYFAPLLLASVIVLVGLVLALPGHFFPSNSTASAAQPRQDLSLGQSLKPLGSLLNTDGTLNLNSGFTGSLDASGWAMASGPGEQPRFVQAGDRHIKTGSRSAYAPLVPGDENWDERFAFPGVNNIVIAIAVSGSNVYIGGYFTYASGTSANYIAKWNGSQWSALGSGLNNTVKAIAINGSDVYVGGDFTTAGGISANGIAKWDGSQWSALGSGVNVSVWAIAINGSDVYVGGDFTTAGGISANRIAKWDGSQWSALGIGVNNIVRGIAINSSDVYVGGYFTTAGGINANRIAKWDGSQWSALGSGANNWIYAVAINGSDVYVGGPFTTAGGVVVNHIAKWNGSQWSALGTGVGSTDSTVLAIATTGSDVYVGGNFSTAGNKPSSFFGIWHSPQPPTPTPTLTSTPTGTPAVANLVGHVVWQGPPAEPNTLQQLPITLTLKLGTTEVNYPAQNTDSSGSFTVSVAGLANGTYAYRVKGPKYLANSGSVPLTGSLTTNVEMGLMRAGDCNNDNMVDMSDFNILRTSFGREVGQTFYDERADFTGDGIVNMIDFALLRHNFNQGGAPPLLPYRP